MSTLQVANIHLESTANNRIQYNGSNSYLIVAGGTTVATVNSSGLTVTGNSNFDSGVLFVDGTNNKVGVGTTSPSAKLDVVGSTELNGDVVFGGAIDEKVYNLTGTALDPSNGTIQYKEITSNVTLTDSISEGESITVMIKSTTPNDTVTWPTTTWVNNGKTAPTTITGDWTVVALWKVSTTLYGALVGDGS